jgi:hypothetical protein
MQLGILGFGGTGFMAKEVVMDALHTPATAALLIQDRDEWCPCGPGIYMYILLILCIFKCNICVCALIGSNTASIHVYLWIYTYEYINIYNFKPPSQNVTWIAKHPCVYYINRCKTRLESNVRSTNSTLSNREQGGIGAHRGNEVNITETEI